MTGECNTIVSSPLEDSDRFAIVVSQWNREITSKLQQGAVELLLAKGVTAENIDVALVPGSWEIPLVAQQFASSGRHAAVIALGVVIRGETTHDQHINRAVSLALSQISLKSKLPVLLGLLTCETREQATERAGGSHGNKGSECAEAAIEMVGLLKNIPTR